MTMNFDIETFQSEELKHALSEYWQRVPEQISTLNRFVFLEWASARLLAGWIPAAAEFDWKTALGKQLWQNMQFAQRILDRKEELAGNRKILIPSEKLEHFVQEVSQADGFMAFLAGWQLEVTKQLIAKYEQFVEALDPIFDAPTLEIIDDVIPKKREQLRWAAQLIHDAVQKPEVLESVNRWRKYTRDWLSHMGGLLETETVSQTCPASPIPEPYGPAPRKRSRPDWLIVGDYDNPPQQFGDNLKVFMWHYLTEIQVIDPMCYAFFAIHDMPFEFYVDFSRHIWDECRHHLMGVRRLKQMGYDLRDIPVPYVEDPLKEPEYFYAMLTMVGEACSFTRKKKSMNAFYEKGDILSGMTAEIDIVDERSHTKFGKKWTQPIYRQRLGSEESLDEIVRGVMGRFMNEIPAKFDDLSEEEKDKLSHIAFCGRLEFKYLNYEKL